MDEPTTMVFCGSQAERITWRRTDGGWKEYEKAEPIYTYAEMLEEWRENRKFLLGEHPHRSFDQWVFLDAMRYW